MRSSNARHAPTKGYLHDNDRPPPLDETTRISATLNFRTQQSKAKQSVSRTQGAVGVRGVH